MKKLFLTILFTLILSGAVNAKIIKVEIKNVSMDDVKSKLIDIHLNQDYEIDEDTSNKITFIKKRKGIMKNLLTAFVCLKESRSMPP